MEGTNCNGEGGWTRLAFVNMSEPNATCPTGLTQFPGENFCTRNERNLVQSAAITTLGLNYTAVCGRLRGYQYRFTEGFFPSNNNSSVTVDDQYADGVPITHGNTPRHHIWTYAIGSEDDLTSAIACPCNNGSNVTTPLFVGDNYYCESGFSESPTSRTLNLNDPLWDGMGCNNLESTCCTRPNMPWFNTTLPDATNDDIELRLMFSQDIRTLGGPINLIELYIR